MRLFFFCSVTPEMDRLKEFKNQIYKKKIKWWLSKLKVKPEKSH